MSGTIAARSSSRSRISRSIRRWDRSIAGPWGRSPIAGGLSRGSAADLDVEPAGGAEEERPGSVEPRGGRDVEPIVLQSAIDLVHLRLGLLKETDVESVGILNFGS